MEKEYYIGLDVGTNSVGFAVTDTKYGVIKIKRKKGWGVRLFDDANDSKERRSFRSNRRRKERSLWRRDIIRELFEKEIKKVDENFFIRLDNSILKKEDKDIVLENSYSIFGGKDYTDKDYHKDYPTIYHLRKELMESKKPHDIRLVYLAIEHIVKNRGHFLFEDMKVQSSMEKENFDEKINDIRDEFFKYVEKKFNKDISENFDYKEFINIIDKNITLNDKKVEVKKLLGFMDKDGKDFKEELIKLLNMTLGSIVTFNINNDEDEEEKENDTKVKIDFSSANFDESILICKNVLNEDLYNIIIKLKEVYDLSRLKKLLKNANSISDAKVNSYNKHKEDLKLLKDIFKKYNGEKYYYFFNESDFEKSKVKENNENYVSYIGMNKKNHIKQFLKKCDKNKFFDTLKKNLNNIKDKDERINKALVDIDNGEFLQKQRNSDNGVLPRQLHEGELKKILDNAKEYLPFLNEKDDKGKTIIDKIIATFEFKVPYYIGPLNPYHKDEKKSHNRKGAWITRKENDGEKLRPWNYEDFIDQEKTAQDFIIRMTNKCTYLPDEDVMPKNSLYYQEYMVLQEINNLVIKGTRINLEQKKCIIELYKKKKNIKLKNIVDKLVSDGLYKEDEISKDDITGINKSTDLIASLETYHKMKEFFNENIEKDSVKKIIEKIVFYLTIYNDGGKIAKNRIEKEFKTELKEYFGIDYDNKIKKLVKLKFSGWSRFSKAFLELSGAKKETGEKVTIIQELRESNKNLMEIIATDDYTFNEIIIAKNKKLNDKLTYSVIEEEYVSPAIKRAIWQALKIVKEIVDIKGYDPSKIFVEMARSEDEKKQETLSRKKQLEDLYKKINDTDVEELKINLEKETDITLRKNLLYLYYTQLGKDMYTGEKIDISALGNSNIYDKDHIYPKSKGGQDSITKNLVLTKKSINQTRKGDVYPLPEDIRKSQSKFWKQLRDLKFITAEKYNRLIRNTDFTDDELGGFIDKQLVETRQSTKIIKNILSQFYEKSKVVCVHANRVTDFRKGVIISKNTKEKSKEFLKVREINNFHHAKDAYLNIVVGNVYNTKYTDNPIMWVKKNKEENNKYSLSMTFAFDVKDVNDNIVWVGGENGTIKTIEKQMLYNDICVTVMPIEKKGEFYNQNICSPKDVAKIKNDDNDSDNDSLLPVKRINDVLLKTSELNSKINLSSRMLISKKLSNANKYGGYKGKNPAYFVLYKYEEIKKKLDKKKNKEVITKKILCRMDTIPIVYIQTIKNDGDFDNKLLDFFKEKTKIEEDEKTKVEISYDNYEILFKNIKINTKICIDGFLYYLKGNNENSILLAPAYEYVVDDETQKIIKNIGKYINKVNENKKNIKVSDFNVTNDDLDKVFNKLLFDLNREPFTKRTANQYNNIFNKKDEFFKLNDEDKAKTINEILKLFQCKVAQPANLKYLNMGKTVGGNMTLTKNIKIINDKVEDENPIKLDKKIKLIFESITGFYRKEYDVEKELNDLYKRK